MNWLKKLLQLLKPDCNHRFKSEEVFDCNFDPKCVRCGKYFELINHKNEYQFEVDNKSIGLHKLKRS